MGRFRMFQKIKSRLQGAKREREKDRGKARQEQLDKMDPKDRENMLLWNQSPAQYQEQLRALAKKYNWSAPDNPGPLSGGKYTMKTGVNIINDMVEGPLSNINQTLPGSYESGTKSISAEEENRRRRLQSTMLTRNSRGGSSLEEAAGGSSGKTLLGQ